MAVAPTFVSVGQQIQGNNVVIYTWAAIGNGTSGTAIAGGGFADRSFQVEGTFGAGGTVVIEGSNDGTNFHTLNDPFNNAISLTSANIRQVTEITAFIRPRVSAGDGTTSITVTAAECNHLPSFA